MLIRYKIVFSPEYVVKYGYIGSGINRQKGGENIRHLEVLPKCMNEMLEQIGNICLRHTFQNSK